jgi:S1-C subfamily serine protease
MEVGRGRRGIAEAAVLGAVALGGGVVALTGAGALGKLGGGTTIQQVSSTAPSIPAAFARGKPMTINGVYRAAAPGVVQITSTSLVTVPTLGFFDDPFAPQQEEEQSLGSGFVIDKAGHIVTNYHVVKDAKSVQVSFSNGENVKAKVVGWDPSSDIAVLEVQTHSRAFTPLRWGDSDAVQVGDSVVAIGNPFGYTRSVTAGIVSALDRPLTAPNDFSISHAIQTDAALNHGNSGGPLLDARGEVIGVNSQISTGNTGQQGNLGIGFAIPSNTVRNVVAQIIENGQVEHASLGIRAQELTPSISQLFRLPVERGLLVASVEPGSGAEKAGVHGPTNDVVVAGTSWSLGGDIIVKVDGVSVPTADKLGDIIADHKPGDTIALEVYRGDSEKTIEVTLGRQPSSP